MINFLFASIQQKVFENMGWSVDLWEYLPEPMNNAVTVSIVFIANIKDTEYMYELILILGWCKNRNRKIPLSFVGFYITGKHSSTTFFFFKHNFNWHFINSVLWLAVH